LRYTDEELLKLVAEERRRSIGFGDGDSGELEAARTRALSYYKGEMSDIPAMENRSTAVDMSIADAIETVLPDVIEVFVGGEDVATFVAQNEKDEASAQEETDFISHVFFVENPGFLNLYSSFKDALLTRTGILHWWWEEEEKDEQVASVPAGSDAEAVQAVAQLLQGQELQSEEREDGTIALSFSKMHGKICVRAFPSEDFTAAADSTLALKDTTYCAVRDRPRVQALIARGIDPEKARALKTFASVRNESTTQARDRAGETEAAQNIADGSGDLRTVEVRDHYIRLASEEDEKKLTVWRVTTDAEETMLLDKVEIGRIDFAVLTPYIVPHRLHGESVADKLFEVQRIKTALLRMLLDSGYFALNQRNEVSMDQANEFTVADLLNNVPGMPVRSKNGEAVRPISTGGLTFDAFAALEFASTMAESRSGIVRNAQGLNPDTLHDTAKGALALMTMAQKRVRMIARIFAETGVKDAFLGIHACLRDNYTDKHAPISAKFGENWKEGRPEAWSERSAMTIHVGVGSAGREHDMVIAGQRLELVNEVIALQKGVQGPFINAANVHNALTAWERAAGSKSPERYWIDPEKAPPVPPQPDPEMAKAQAQAQLEEKKAAAGFQIQQQKNQGDMALQQQKHEADAMAAEAQAQRDHELAVAKLQTDMILKREQMTAELGLKREQLAAELQLKREQMTAELALKTAQADHAADLAEQSADIGEVSVGGKPG